MKSCKATLIVLPDSLLSFHRGDLLPIMDKYTWGDAEEALRDALKMEKFVTKEIKTIIDVCSDADSNVSAQDMFCPTRQVVSIRGGKMSFIVQGNKLQILTSLALSRQCVCELYTVRRPLSRDIL